MASDQDDFDPALPRAMNLLAYQLGKTIGPSEDLLTAIPGLSLHRRVRPSIQEPCLYDPSVALVVSGEKQVTLGEDAFVLVPRSILITSAHLPVTPQILSASVAKPYLSLLFKLNLTTLSTLVLQADLPPMPRSGSRRAMALGEATPALLDAFRRLLSLLETPLDVPVLAPLIEQELLYRLLSSPQGGRLRELVAVGGPGHRISRAIKWLGSHFSQPLDIAVLAEHVDMSPSTFHRSFKEVTAMSPLQYQKTLRLATAQRLMLTQKMDVARAAFEVGYVSASQFSREYRREFGTSPTSHITALRQTT